MKGSTAESGIDVDIDKGVVQESSSDLDDAISDLSETGADKVLLAFEVQEDGEGSLSSVRETEEEAGNLVFTKENCLLLKFTKINLV